MTNIGLVLGGGGARGAYQAGAIRAISDILTVKRCPFTILTGTSSGAINAVAIAIGADDFPRTAERLCRTWESLTPSSVYRTDLRTLAWLGLRWVVELSTGGIWGSSRVNHLLDTQPLRRMLQRGFDVSRLPRHFAAGILRGVAVSAVNYLTGTNVTFFDGAPDIEPWVRRGRITVREPIGIDHVLASSAIPIFFPPVRIDGRIYGDGGVRLSAPLSPAVHMGADKILSIGIRYARPPATTLGLHMQSQAESVTVSEIAGVLLDSSFLDALDNDLERLERINRTVGAIPETEWPKLKDRLRFVLSLALRPSQDLGRLAADQYTRFPAMLRHLLRGIGASGDTGWDLLSYLAFQPAYMQKLIELGAEDTFARRDEIEAFFSAASEENATSEPPALGDTGFMEKAAGHGPDTAHASGVSRWPRSAR